MYLRSFEYKHITQRQSLALVKLNYMLETPQKLCTTRQDVVFSVKMYKTRGQSAGKTHKTM